MACECGHQLKEHEWNFRKWKPQPCLECDCKDFKSEFTEALEKRYKPYGEKDEKNNITV